MCVLILLCVPSYYHMCVLILYVCPMCVLSLRQTGDPTTTSESFYYYMCPHTTIHVSSC